MSQPSSDHDAAGAGIGELAWPERLQPVDVRDLIRRKDDTRRAGIHNGAVAAFAERDAQPRHRSDVLAWTSRVDVREINAAVVFVISAERTGRDRHAAEQQPCDRGTQNRRNCQGRSQCWNGLIYNHITARIAGSKETPADQPLRVLVDYAITGGEINARLPFLG